MPYKDYEEQKRNAREYYLKNREEIRKKRKKFYDNNRERLLEEKREYYADNIETLREKNRVYYSNNKEKVKEYYQDNKMEIRKKKRQFYADNIEKERSRMKKQRREKKKILLEHLGNVCSHPDCNETKNLQFDHINPFEKSFCPPAHLTKSLDELIIETNKCQLLCTKHHMEKTLKEWEDGTLYTKKYKVDNT
tara:strand:- start:9 stop:587 length:579 start_codon:yes stop_codon:yes gene_type:complete